MLAALLLFPLSWGAAGLAVGLAGGGALAGVAAAVAAPLTGWIALRFWERLEWLAAGARLAWVWITQRSLLGRLADERAAIYDAVVALDRRLHG
ncbi:MAG: hypothetical protein H6710_22090 [Myxococcales bacterium]|nr:hypothetical protein [Myxococcales bacterium]